jgi:NADH dehydrogenase
MKTDRRKHVVVLGAGFAGLECCAGLEDRDDVRVTLVDRQNHHLFQPLLYQVASAGLAAPEIAHPVRSIFSEQRNISVLMAEVSRIDIEKKRVELSGHDPLVYDYLVIGIGVKTSYFGNDEWAQYTRGLKSLDDATELRREILLAFEKAEACEDEERKKQLMTAVIVGGGPTGVELAGAFAELANHVLAGDFRNVDTTQARIVLIEAQDRLLQTFDYDLSAYTAEKLTAMGVEVRTDTRVEKVSEGIVELSGGEKLAAANIVWAAGVEAPAVVRAIDGVECDRAGRLVVEKDLCLPGRREVFAVGDIARCVDQAGVTVPGLCPAAMQMGKHAAKVIIDDLKRGSRGSDYPVRPQFRYFDKGSMATIGRSAAVASSMGLKFKGFIAWLMWLFVHLLFLVGFRNKIAVLLQWFYAYVRYRRGARIITGVDSSGSARRDSGSH